LQRECAGRRSPIRPEPRLAAVPAVLGGGAVGERGMVAVGDLAVDSKRTVRAQLCALPRSGAALEIAGSRDEQSALCLRSASGDDRNGRWRVGQALGATRYRGDLEIGEFLQAQVG